MSQNYDSILKELDKIRKGTSQIVVAPYELYDMSPTEAAYRKFINLNQIECAKISTEKREKRKKEIKAKNDALSAQELQLNRDLIWAIVEGNIEKVAQLLEQGADPNYCETDNNYLGICANAAYRLNQYSYPKTSPFDHYSSSVTPLVLACSAGNLPLVKLLLQYQANPNETNSDMQSPMLYACINGNNAVVKYLLDNTEIDLKSESPDAVCLQGYSSIVYYNSSLSIAASLCSFEIVKQMLDMGADFRKYNPNFGTAFGAALDTQKLLKRQNREDLTLLYTRNFQQEAEEKDRKKILELLLNHGLKLEEELLLYRLHRSLDDDVAFAEILQIFPELSAEIKLLTEAESSKTMTTNLSLDIDTLRSSLTRVTGKIFGYDIKPQQNDAIFKILYPDAALGFKGWVAYKAVSLIPIPMKVLNFTGKPFGIQADLSDYVKLLYYFTGLSIDTYSSCPRSLMYLIMEYIFNPTAETQEIIRILHGKRFDYLMSSQKVYDSFVAALEQSETQKRLAAKVPEREHKKGTEQAVMKQSFTLLEAQSNSSETTIACHYGREMQIQHYSDVAQNQKDFYLKMDALQRAKLDEMRRKLDAMNSKVHQSSEDLMMCIRGGNIEGVRQALDAGADIHFTVLSPDFNINDKWVYPRRRRGLGLADDIHTPGITPLISAIENRQWEIVDLLLQQKADVNQSNLAFESPLMFACESRNNELVSRLLKLKADVNIQTGGWGRYFKKKANVFHYYFNFQNRANLHSSYLDLQIVKYLEEHGVNIHQQDYDGFTPLSCLIDGLVRYYSNDNEAQKNILEIIEYFISQNADLYRGILIRANRSIANEVYETLKKLVLMMPMFAQDIKLVLEALYCEQTQQTEAIDKKKLFEFIPVLFESAYECVLLEIEKYYIPLGSDRLLLSEAVKNLYNDQASTAGKNGKLQEVTKCNNSQISYDHQPYEELFEVFPELPAKALGLIYEYYSQNKVITSCYSEQVSLLHQARFCVLTGEKPASLAPQGKKVTNQNNSQVEDSESPQVKKGGKSVKV